MMKSRECTLFSFLIYLSAPYIYIYSGTVLVLCYKCHDDRGIMETRTDRNGHMQLALYAYSVYGFGVRIGHWDIGVT